MWLYIVQILFLEIRKVFQVVGYILKSSLRACYKVFAKLYLEIYKLQYKISLQFSRGVSLHINFSLCMNKFSLHRSVSNVEFA